MDIQLRGIDGLTLDPANARKHSARNIAAISESLSRFGQRRPAVVRSDGTVLAGNGMVEAARGLGWSEVAVTVVPDGWSPEEARAYALADNRTAELAEWDQDVLRSHLVELEVAGWDVDALGFDAPTAPESEIVEDVIPEPRKASRIKSGEAWRLGGHTLACGDATDPSVAASVEASACSAIVTDPPYGIGYGYNEHDDSDNAQNARLVADVFAHGPDVLIWTPGLRNLPRDIQRFGVSKVLVWNKKFAAAGNGLGGASVWEPILVVGKPSNRALKVDVIEVSTDRELLDGQSLRDLHSCPKPVELYARLIQAFTNPGESIYEPFCGSGTTLIAAEQTGRVCRAVELDPVYVDVIIRRWEALTGEKAVRADG